MFDAFGTFTQAGRTMTQHCLRRFPFLAGRQVLRMSILGVSVALSLMAGGKAAADDESDTLAFPKTEGVSVHLQSTFTPQGNLPFEAPFSGIKSLDPKGQAVEAWTITGFLGARLWDGGEAYFNPEMFHGFGLRNPNGTIGTVGIAGFPNGEAQKGGRWDADLEVARLYLSQTFGFGGETETIKDDLNRIAATKDISRLTLTFGRFAANDFFDNNAYAHDPRTQFQNESIYEAGAFDYAADAKGYTVGAIADFNQKDWAFRAGYFLVPAEPGSLTLDTDFSERGGAIAELEERYKLFGQNGILRLLGFANTVFSGSYAEAVALSPNAPDIEATRKDRTKYGFVINVEQAITPGVGAFFRYSRNSGQIEESSFTDINESVSGGFSIKGSLWGRADDTAGIGGAVNAISPEAQRFFAAGGTGLVIGDGTLFYSGEKIVEIYYSCAVTGNLAVSFDYQYVANPAYNTARGPVNVLGGRLHVQF
jgi:high affinity Mn2+ porin